LVTLNLTQELVQLHAELCSALADSNRLVILYVLSDQPCNVTELTQRLDTPQSTVSRHLKVLRDGGLVRATRQGMSVVYELTDSRVIEALDLLRSVLRDRIQHHADLIDDLDPSKKFDE
jgi:DNA-binding transcriptional ArsR family regulator